MEMRRLLIADATDEFRRSLQDALQTSYHVCSCRDGKTALELIRSFLPDIVVLDLMLPGLDGISLLQAAAEAEIRPMVLATTCYTSDYVIEAVTQLGVGYLMVKPCDISATVERIRDLHQRLRPPIPVPADPRARISSILQQLGIPAKLDGYEYLREAILLTSETARISITKELYPAVGVLCHCSSGQAERSIRSAIEKAWANRDDNIWQMYFTPAADGTLPRPSNGTFICQLADYLRLSKEKTLFHQV